MRFLQPPGWAPPKGYANGVLAEGRLLFVAGQIGWDAEQRIVSDDFAVQTEQALRNVAAVLAEGGAAPRHVVRLTWYVADKRAYLAAQRDVGRAYRAVFGDHYPPMTLVEVADLLEDGALVEIEATAVIGGSGDRVIRSHVHTSKHPYVHVMPEPTAHADTFARDHLPPRDLWPDLLLDGDFAYPPRLNCAAELLDKAIADGHGERVLFHTADGPQTYAAFQREVNRIAHVLVDDLGLVPGNRVLLRGPNTPRLAACWFAVVKAGGICVTTMPLLRAFELTYTVEKAQVGLALCDARFRDEMEKTQAQTDVLETVAYFFSDEDDGLEARMAGKPDTFEAVDTAADNVVLIAFTSGTTGKAKATMHFHRDVLAICDAFPTSCLRISADDVFVGSPPLAFTFGLGGDLLFPMRFGASCAFIEKPSVETLLQTIQDHRATVCFTSPTAYRAMLGRLGEFDVSSLRQCVSAGEPLPAPTFHAWREATGIKIIDGIGSTEMLHIFISAPEDALRPGTTGTPIPGYEAKVVDERGEEVPPGTVGALAVRGPTGCRYLDDEDRQREYVRRGWNYPGDAYLMDEDGYFHYQARTDDLIVSSGYNISGLQVESALLKHAAVAECGVIGVPDEARGQIVKAFVVLRDGFAGDDALAKELQDFVKGEIAPYKYPRAVAFMDALPRTQTGKLQRFRLREMEE